MTSRPLIAPTATRLGIRVGIGITAAVTALALTGCSTPTTDTTTTAAAGADTLTGDVTVLAAASLVESFDAIIAGFEAEHPEVSVTVSYDGSSALATQLAEGAPADVFASADTAIITALAGAGVTDPAEPFASNSLQIAVPIGNPAGVTTLADLSNPVTAVVLCASEVPCGTVSHRLLDGAGVQVTPKSEEQNVKAVLAKLVSNDADAGLVYTTDVAASAGAVEGIRIPGSETATTEYSVTIPTGAKNPAAGRAFADWVLGPNGQATLAGFGFHTP